MLGIKSSNLVLILALEIYACRNRQKYAMSKKGKAINNPFNLGDSNRRAHEIVYKSEKIEAY